MASSAVASSFLLTIASWMPRRVSAFKRALKVDERFADVVVSAEVEAFPADFTDEAAPQHVVEIEDDESARIAVQCRRAPRAMSAAACSNTAGREWRLRRVPQLVRPAARPTAANQRAVSRTNTFDVAQNVGQREVHPREQVRRCRRRDGRSSGSLAAVPWRQHPCRERTSRGVPRANRATAAAIRPRFFQRLLRDRPASYGDRARKAARRSPRAASRRRQSIRGPAPRRQRPHHLAVWRRPRFSARQRGVRDQSRQRLDVEVGDRSRSDVGRFTSDPRQRFEIARQGVRRSEGTAVVDAAPFVEQLHRCAKRTRRLVLRARSRN